MKRAGLCIVTLVLAGCSGGQQNLSDGIASPTLTLSSVNPKSGFNRVTICGGMPLVDTTLRNGPHPPLLKLSEIEPVEIIFKGTRIPLAYDEKIVIDYKSNFNFGATRLHSFTLFEQGKRIASSTTVTPGTKYVTINSLKVFRPVYGQYPVVSVTRASLSLIHNDERTDCHNKRLIDYSVI